MLILASASKARLELLESVGITPDKILNTNIDETPNKSEKPLDYVSRIALEKNKSVKKKKNRNCINCRHSCRIGKKNITKTQ